jgi:hypothetical protein
MCLIDQRASGTAADRSPAIWLGGCARCRPARRTRCAWKRGRPLSRSRGRGASSRTTPEAERRRGAERHPGVDPAEPGSRYRTPERWRWSRLPTMMRECHGPRTGRRCGQDGIAPPVRKDVLTKRMAGYASSRVGSSTRISTGTTPRAATCSPSFEVVTFAK